MVIVYDCLYFLLLPLLLFFFHFILRLKEEGNVVDCYSVLCHFLYCSRMRINTF